MKNKLPIWMTDWTLQHPKNKNKIIIKDVICKGWTSNDIINNDMLIKKVINRLGNKKKNLILIPIHVKLKSQHGYGPKYENEKLFT
tara:strand:- start:192 stop:449 length:258 start_codon:yes stop_codon:yes gene_type:complete